MSGFCHFGLVYSWFCDRALTLPSCLVSCERAASSVLKPCALSSACFVSCWSVVFGSWHSCLVQALFWFRVGVRTLTLHVQSCCGSMRSRVRSGPALLCPRVLCFVRHVFRVRPHAFSLSFVACSSFFGCVLSLFCHVLCEHVAFV